MSAAKFTPGPWRTEVRVIDGRRVTLVLRGYGSLARYMTDERGAPQQFTAAEARAAIAKAAGGAQ